MTAAATTGLELLTGDGAAELMTAVLDATGGRLLRWRTRQVDHQPGRRTTASYSARVRWADGTVTDETLAAASGELPGGVARLSDGDTEIGMWRFPFDPDLPGLPAACDERRMATVADGLGVGGPGVGGGVRLRVRAYRPRRRAVVEVTGDRGTVFVKVVRPGKAQALHERHRTATAAGCPVPAPLGWSDDGLVVLAGLPGRTLRAHLLGGGRDAVGAEDVVAVLDALPAGFTERRRTWGQKAPHYAGVITAAAPELAARAWVIARAVDHGDEPEGVDVPVHGDFYESQLMVQDGRVTGALDIDTAGRGERLDDAACLLGHLGVLAQLEPARAGAINGLALRLQRRFERDLHPAALARRTAAVVLSLATGPHRVQERNWPTGTRRRLVLAERWLAAACCSG